MTNFFDPENYELTRPEQWAEDHPWLTWGVIIPIAIAVLMFLVWMSTWI